MMKLPLTTDSNLAIEIASPGMGNLVFRLPPWCFNGVSMVSRWCFGRDTTGRVTACFLGIVPFLLHKKILTPPPLPLRFTTLSGRGQNSGTMPKKQAVPFSNIYFYSYFNFSSFLCFFFFLSIVSILFFLFSSCGCFALIYLFSIFLTTNPYQFHLIRCII